MQADRARADSPRGAAVRRGAWAAAALLALAAACAPKRESEPLERSGRCGSLRDLALFTRAAAQGGPFFLDRFEVTRLDLAEFAASHPTVALPLSVREVEPDQRALPAAQLDLPMARALAAWRFCRLPRADEWSFACTIDGRDVFPWGSRADPARANTSDLGLFLPLAVGTFESGRRQGGPYDLIGNVSEWTETVPTAWFYQDRDPAPVLFAANARLWRNPALQPWALPGRLFAPSLVVAAAGEAAPREVLGADFRTPMRESSQWRSPSDRSDAIGLRLCTTPRELLAAMGPALGSLSAEEQRQLSAFCRRPGHAEALRAALPEARLDAAVRRRWEEALP